MLTWMQRHKKWLVVTIWVSTIAFIGAGFVGWGTYDLNLNRTSSVAKVGDEKIGFAEFDLRYKQYFGLYNQIGDSNLDEQKAKEMGLDILALQSLVEDKLLLNYAKELGIAVGEDEVVNTLIAQEIFHDFNGSFDKNIYYELLTANGLKPSDYEEILASDILLQKINSLFFTNNSEDELEMLASSFFMQDDLNIGLVKPDELSIQDINQAKLEELYSEHKNELLMPQFYDISSYFIPAQKEGISENELQAFYEANKQDYTDFTGKILAYEDAKEQLITPFALEQLKDEANQAYLSLGKGELSFQKDLRIDDNDVFYPIELFEGIKAGALLKPFKFKQDGEDGLLILRVNAIQEARVKTFEEAKEELMPLYEQEIKKEALEQKAQLALKDFQGQNIGFVSRDSTRNLYKIDEELMNDTEFSYFLMNVFNSDQNSSYVLFDDKAILYKINRQRLAGKEKMQEYQSDLSQNLSRLKSEQIRQKLISELRKRYEIKIYYKGSQS